MLGQVLPLKGLVVRLKQQLDGKFSMVQIGKLQEELIFRELRF